MATFFLFGKYSPEALKGISADRTKKAQKIVEDLGGSLKDGYALLGASDLILIVDLPGMPEAVKASVALTRQTGIAFSTSQAVSIEEFDTLVS